MRTFKKLENLLHLKRHYRVTFSTPEGKQVLKDLAALCHAASTTFDADPREQARREGKRQVWLRIQNMLNIPDAELIVLAKEDDNA